MQLGTQTRYIAHRYIPALQCFVNACRIPAYMKEAVLCVAIKKHSNMSTWNKLWQLYTTSNYQYEKNSIISVMSCATNETLLKK